MPPTSAASRVHRRLGGLWMDTSPLRDSHDFRLLFSGQIVSLVGSQVRVVALPYQVYLLTHSSAMVGLLSLAQFVPLLVFSLLGGAIADVVDRRRVLFCTQAALMATSTLLALMALSGRAPLGWLFAVAAVAASVSAVDDPTRRATIAQLVSRDRVAAALSLNQAMSQLSNIVGPALGGLILASLGLGPAYVIDAASFGAVLLALVPMAPIPPHSEDDAGPAPAGAPRGRPPALRAAAGRIREGFGYLRSRPVLLSASLVDVVANVFGAPKALYPALATTVFRTGPEGLGLLYAAPAAGALAGALTSGWLGRVRRQGQVVLRAIVVWGASITAFGLLTQHFWLALLALAVSGAANMVSAVLRNTIMQSTVPNRLRGRLTAIYMMFTQGGPRLGDAEAGLVAQATSVTFSVVSGGIAAIVGVLALALAMPSLPRHEAQPAEAASEGA